MEVYLLTYLPDAEEIMARAAYATASEKNAREISVSRDMIAKMIKWTKQMKLSSVLDFPFYIFGFSHVSRSFTHQWVRYRIAAHMQQSLRYVKVETSKDWFVIPPTILAKGADAIVAYIRSQQKAAETYKRLLDMGIPAEDARFALPIGTATHISSAMDAEELIHVMNQRLCFDAQWEIRTASSALLVLLKLVSPELFRRVGPHCIYEGICRGRGKGRCLAEARELVRKIEELAEENRTRFEALKPGEELRIDMTEAFGYVVPPEVKEEVYEKLGSKVKLDFEVIGYARKVC